MSVKTCYITHWVDNYIDVIAQFLRCHIRKNTTKPYGYSVELERSDFGRMLWDTVGIAYYHYFDKNSSLRSQYFDLTRALGLNDGWIYAETCEDMLDDDNYDTIEDVVAAMCENGDTCHEFDVNDFEYDDSGCNISDFYGIYHDTFNDLWEKVHTLEEKYDVKVLALTKFNVGIKVLSNGTTMYLDEESGVLKSESDVLRGFVSELDISQYAKDYINTFKLDFSARSVATLVCHYSKDDYFLRRVIQFGGDENVAVEVEDYLETKIGLFSSAVKRGGSVWILTHNNESERFDNYEDASKWLHLYKSAVLRRYRKTRRQASLDTDDFDGEFIFEYSHLKWFWCEELNSYPWPENCFEDSVVALPHIFNKGDIVKSIDGGWLGVVETTRESADELNAKVAENPDIYDFIDSCNVVVEILCNDGEFCHHHCTALTITPANLQDDHPAYNVLHAASEYMRGNAWLDRLCYEMKKYRQE